MKNFLFKLYLGCIKLVLQFTKTDANKYVILNGAGRSGSNGFLFYKYLRENHPEISVELVEPFPTTHLSFKTWQSISRAKFIFVTHEPFKIKRNQICVELWHGIPLKRMGFMAKNTNPTNNLKTMKTWAKEADYVASSSALYESLMSACVGISDDKYLRVGFPRIDALYGQADELSEAIIEQLFDAPKVNKQTKLGIYMPTFRFELENESVMQEISAGNFLAVSDFDLQQLNAFLQQHNQFLLVRLHPYEQKFMKQELRLSNIAVLEDAYLVEHELDLYEILRVTDYLITDFSSVYFDYLHLNKPVYFLANHLNEYLAKRGILLDPYEKVTPGVKVTSQTELEQAMVSDDHYAAKRTECLELSYSIPKNANSQRLFDQLIEVKGD